MMAVGVESLSTKDDAKTAAVNGHRKYHTAETPYTLPAGTDADEWHRLNAQHYGIKSYWGGNNAGAQWPENPKKILEISVGSGVWALEVAEQFPGAEVVGVDIVEPKLERKPTNFTFKMLNVVKDPWPFASDTFDIVHCRFLTMHIPEFHKLLEKAIDATAPGGILMFEDPDLGVKSDTKPVPTAAQLFFAIYHGCCESVGVDARPGPKFASIIRGSRKCSEIHETLVSVPMGDWTEDKRLHGIGLGMQAGLIEGARGQNPRMFQFGMTREIVEGMVKEVQKNENQLYYDLYFVWARKRRALV
ncbi:S-adenosyl-L-methionine-dependent methyltransferase [Calocera viscosa TUFC12733]|uniref:S-adenosyl-L-methionine-dependent methyltransferase n=1 Tax=Calocera viscosa (strain TUFC12733) TaxID=1330018 RepID=A0A167GPD3_CALVF|nr:S-adenosyl-L-methionine-dependent methyltransferase [Calocera viscosa TUFC12733]